MLTCWLCREQSETLYWVRKDTGPICLTCKVESGKVYDYHTPPPRELFAIISDYFEDINAHALNELFRANTGLKTSYGESVNDAAYETLKAFYAQNSNR